MQQNFESFKLNTTMHIFFFFLIIMVNGMCVMTYMLNYFFIHISFNCKNNLMSFTLQTDFRMRKGSIQTPITIQEE